MKKLLFLILLLNFTKTEAQTSVFSIVDTVLKVAKYRVSQLKKEKFMKIDP